MTVNGEPDQEEQAPQDEQATPDIAVLHFEINLHTGASQVSIPPGNLIFALGLAELAKQSVLRKIQEPPKTSPIIPGRMPLPRGLFGKAGK